YFAEEVVLGSQQELRSSVFSLSQTLAFCINFNILTSLYIASSSFFVTDLVFALKLMSQ
ncbi:unnamed protein product, partial [Amoebophrya sp. A120]